MAAILDETSPPHVTVHELATTPPALWKAVAADDPDVWEHAYYVDCRNQRPKFVEVFLASRANRAFAAKNFS